MIGGPVLSHARSARSRIDEAESLIGKAIRNTNNSNPSVEDSAVLAQAATAKALMAVAAAILALTEGPPKPPRPLPPPDGSLSTGRTR
ncbi:hypothetical protein GCM10009557_11600 [Virgisporangium ochraceum]|uniref:Uncharacterized protein n=1 Tax=Virgisporangium ochraceum TaxID=65505 RepID=A0A8J3ZYN4_9ACTN|nr:hypothetical protein Voc01_048070 [Virgisporangium ochraceum]